MLIPKEAYVRNKKYLKYVNGLPCMLTYETGEAHHLLRAQKRGVGLKTGDNWVVPLSHAKHMELHRSGNEIKFFENHGWEYNKVLNYAKMLYNSFLNGTVN